MSTINFRLIRQLWMFLAVAEEQHFGRAAKRLGMSQPPLTEQIKTLEHALKLTLFERSRRGTQLSPAGAAILPAVKQFATHVETLERVVKEVAAGQSGVLHIGAITSAMLDIVPPLIKALQQTYPNLTVRVEEIDSVEAVPRLERGELDLAFVRLDGNVNQHIASRPLIEDTLAIALANTHPLAKQSRISLSQLDNEQFVMSSRQVSPVYFDMLTSACRKHGFSPRILHEVRSVASQVAYVSCGQGSALVPLSMQRLAPDNVVVLPLEESIHLVTVAMAWNPKRHHPIIDDVIHHQWPQDISTDTPTADE